MGKWYILNQPWYIDMHDEIKNSGLGDVFKIRPMTDCHELGKFLGKIVQYKKELLTADFIETNGVVCLGKFLIKEVQIDYKSIPRLRGYSLLYNDTFGNVINHEEVELCQEN